MRARLLILNKILLLSGHATKTCSYETECCYSLCRILFRLDSVTVLMSLEWCWKLLSGLQDQTNHRQKTKVRLANIGLQGGERLTLLYKVSSLLSFPKTTHFLSDISYFLPFRHLIIPFTHLIIPFRRLIIPFRCLIFPFRRLIFFFKRFSLHNS